MLLLLLLLFCLMIFMAILKYLLLNINFKEILYSYQIILFFLYFGKFFTVSMNLLFISSKRCMIRQKRKKQE